MPNMGNWANPPSANGLPAEAPTFNWVVGYLGVIIDKRYWPKTIRAPKATSRQQTVWAGGGLVLRQAFCLQLKGRRDACPTILHDWPATIRQQTDRGAEKC